MNRSLLPVFLSAALTFAAYAVFVQAVPFKAVSAQNQNDTNLIRMQDYLHAPDGRLVLVGSSLTFRLQQQMLGPNIANLALAGDGAQTGLQIIRDFGARPEMVLIETNLLMHPNDAALVKSQLRWPERGLRERYRVFRTGYDPLNFLKYCFKALLHKPESVETIFPDVTRQLTLLQRRDKSSPPDPARLQMNLDNTAALVAALQARGIRVGFFEMPIDPGLTHLPFDEALRSAVLKRFPPSDYAWVPLAIPGGAHTVDGIHLGPQEATLVARQIAAWNGARSR